MRVAWFLPHAGRDYNRMSASLWIRCWQLIPYLDALGVRSIVNQPGVDADIAIFVRWQNEGAIAQAEAQKARGQKVIFDLVVNYYDLTEEGEVPYLGNPVKAHHVQQAHRMTALADAVTASSAFIAERASREHPRAVYLPDSVDLRHFRRRKSPLAFFRPKLRAIWSGTYRKIREIEPLLPIMEAHNIPLTVVADDDLPDLHYGSGKTFAYHYVPWRYETFPRSLLRGEVCVVYRELDNTYNLGHSLFKIAVFMAQGVPVLASPVPAYREVLGEPGAGLLCETPDEWRAAFRAIREDRRMLLSWSQEAPRRIEPYSTERVARQYLTLFRDLVS